MVVAAHVHTKLDRTDGTCDGKQTIAEAVESAQVCGFDGVVFTPHTTNPGVGGPHHFGDDDPLAEMFYGYWADITRYLGHRDMALFGGLEANIMPDGTIDAPPDLASAADLVIASLHGDVPQDAAEIEHLFMAACDDPNVDVLGHPQRNVHKVLDINWPRIFDHAAVTKTAIEINFNAWHSYGPNKARRERDVEPEQKRQNVYWWTGYHFEWLQVVCESKVKVLKSLDIHNPGMWPRAEPSEPWMPTWAQYNVFDRLPYAFGLLDYRVINNHVAQLAEVVKTPKDER